MNIYIFFFWSLCACLFYSCTDPILDNPFEEYIPPELNITNSEKNEDEITISWQADNQFALEFSYMLEPIEVEWSAWSTDTSVYYNYFDEVMKKEIKFIKKGGKFIVPLPEPKIIEP